MSKTLPQRLQRCVLGVLEPVAAVDMPYLGCHTLLRVIRPLEVSVELPVSMPIIHIIPSIPFFHELIKSDEFWSEDENPPHFEKAALAQL